MLGFFLVLFSFFGFFCFGGVLWKVFSSLVILMKASLYSKFSKVLGCPDSLCDIRSLLFKPNESNKIAFNYLKPINSLLSV